VRPVFLTFYPVGEFMEPATDDRVLPAPRDNRPGSSAA